MSNFIVFKQAIAAQFAVMQKVPLFRTGVEKDDLWSTYLQSFPEGTNPIFRERTEYDCTCCKQFIRAIGDVVAIIDGKLVSLWDAVIDDPAYSVVAQAMSKLVKAHAITGPFYHYERTAGTDKTFEERVGLTAVAWSHFHVNIPAKFVLPKSEIPSKVGEQHTLAEVFMRSLSVLSMDSVNTVLELIEQGTLYRGEEHLAAVKAFKKAKQEFDKFKNIEEFRLYVWTVLSDTNIAVARFRNTVIGTLVSDLSEGADLEQAVKSFESKVAPTNYKRPTALITKAMIENAKEKIAQLGLTSALDRRYAKVEDLSVNDILFADRTSKKSITGDVFDDISATASAKPKNLDKVETISINKFVSDVLPNINTMEVMLEAKHRGNLFTLVAPVDPTAGQLFKWNNGFSWSYNGEVADSIKERVKEAGGNVTGDLCCRLAWEYRDDLDFHMVEPNGEHIWFRERTSRSGGKLDIDANGGNGMMDHPVENIFYTNRNRMQEGVYQLYVHNYSRRDMEASGFDVEIDYLGDVLSFHYDKAVSQSGQVLVAKFKYTHAGGIQIIEGLPGGSSSKSVWNLPTNQFHKVNLMMLSPNYWEGQGVGNKHTFFVLEGCKNESDPRGFFNEFLCNNLNEHRKVFEIVGSKMKAVEGAANQLSGLGFSSTKKDELLVKVTGSFTRTLKIVF